MKRFGLAFFGALLLAGVAIAQREPGGRFYQPVVGDGTGNFDQVTVNGPVNVTGVTDAGSIRANGTLLVTGTTTAAAVNATTINGTVINASTGVDAGFLFTPGTLSVGGIATITGRITQGYASSTDGGDVTLSVPSGRFRVGAGRGSTPLTITNTLVSATSIVMAMIERKDTTCALIWITPGTGSFSVQMASAANTAANCTADTNVSFWVLNP